MIFPELLKPGLTEFRNADLEIVGRIRPFGLNWVMKTNKTGYKNLMSVGHVLWNVEASLLLS